MSRAWTLAVLHQAWPKGEGISHIHVLSFAGSVQLPLGGSLQTPRVTQTSVQVLQLKPCTPETLSHSHNLCHDVLLCSSRIPPALPGLSLPSPQALKSQILLCEDAGERQGGG